MDVSSEYVAQCDCPEIQEVFKGFDLNQYPHYVYDKVTERVSTIFWSPNSLKDKIGNAGNVLIVSIESDREKNQYVPEYDGDFCESIIWLPTQSQLQEMVEGEWEEVFERFANGVGCNDFDYTHEEMGDYELYKIAFTSMEQLWLSFVMWELHKKKWDGGKWDENT